MRKLVLILFVFSFAFVSLVPGENTRAQRQKQEQTPEHERIVEEVEVVNVEVPVRVFYKKKPVKGLKKSDFKLYVDGEERPINGFYEVRQKLDPPAQSREPVQGDRLFVLIFNVGSNSRDLEKGMQYFFKQVIRPNDRIMVLTNNVFLKERVVEDPQKELEKLLKILNLEARKTSFKLSSLESSLRYLAADLKYELQNQGSHRGPENAIQRFLTNYKDYYSEFKAIFFNPPEEQYIKVAEYLKHQQVEKWVIHFYQIPQFPQLKISGGVLYKAIDNSFKSRKLPNPYINDIQRIMGMPADPDFIGHIDKLFLNTGATFHTLLLKSMMSEYFEEYDYRPVSTDSEHIFRQVTQLTHGNVMASTNMEKFVEKISEKEDVYYVLTYTPKKAPQGTKNKGKINVAVTHKKYRKARTTYDNQQRAGYLKKMIRKIKKEVPHIRIQGMESKDGILSALISGVLLAQDPEGKRGKILLTVKLLNENAVLISSTQKAFISKNSNFSLAIRLPGLKKGNYNLMLEVHDLNTGGNDLELKDLNNPEDYTLEPGQVPFQFIKVPVLRNPGAETSILNKTADVNTNSNIKPPSAFNEIQADSTLLEEFKDTVSASSSLSKEGIDQNMLPGILDKVAAYCQQLEAVSLNFFCIEDIYEKVLNTLQRRGKILKGKSENVKRLTYGYQLIRDKNKIREKRILLKQNGWKRMKENAELKTRFKYKNIVYGPSIFNKHLQPYYQYEIIGKRNWNNKNVLIVEAVPNSMQEQRFAAGRIWVDENDYSILRIEIYQQSIGNFAEIEEMAEKYQVEPRITIINEYDILKSGIRFPSRVYYEEAYKDEKGNYMVQSQVNVTFSDYQFYTVETKVTY